MSESKETEVGPVTNGGKEVVETGFPYAVRVEIVGVADLLFHRWNVEGVEAKGKAAKGSAAKKTDDLESYVYRTDAGDVGLPGEYLRGAIVNAAKFRQDPRSPRKSAMDLFKAGIVPLTTLAPVARHWDYEHRARVMVQRNGITRTRPAFKSGWRAEVDLLCNLPEYIPARLLAEVIADAGRLIGVGDFRPTYGRFVTARFEII